MVPDDKITRVTGIFNQLTMNVLDILFIIAASHRMTGHCFTIFHCFYILYLSTQTISVMTVSCYLFCKSSLCLNKINK